MLRRLLRAIALACAVAMAPLAALSATSATPVAWLEYQASGDHNAVFPASSLSTTWRLVFNGKINGGLAIVDGIIYVDSFDRALYAIRVRDGKTLWKSLTGGVLMSTPVIKDGIVIVGSGTSASMVDHAAMMLATPRGDALYAFSTSTGRLLWRYTTIGSDMVSPAIEGNTVVFANGDRHAYALDLYTGRLRWKIPLYGTANMDSVMIDHGVAILGSCYDVTSDCRTQAIDVASGKILWKTPLGSGDAAATISDNLVFIGDLASDPKYDGGGRNIAAALAKSTGQLLWMHTAAASMPCSSVGSKESEIAGTVTDDILFQPYGCGAQIVALDIHTGREVWSSPLDAPVKMSPVIYRGRVYFGDTAGVFYILDAHTGKPLHAMSFPHPFSTSPPVIIGNTIFVADERLLYAFPINTFPISPDIATRRQCDDRPAYSDGQATNGHLPQPCTHP